MKIDFERLFAPAGFARSGFPRMPTILGGAVVATSHPAATRAGVRALENGGNAIDAALAAAACLTVCEPTENGVGGDAFSIIWHGGKLHGINGSGRSPMRLPEPVVEQFGPRSTTVPGAVAEWADLVERFGRLGLDRALAPAIDLAENGVAAGARISDKWRAAQGRAPWPPPRAAQRYTLPELDARSGGSPSSARRGSTRAPWPRRSRRRHGSTWTTWRRTVPSGWSRCVSLTGASRSASSHPMAPAARRCSRSGSSTGSSAMIRSAACTARSSR